MTIKGLRKEYHKRVCHEIIRVNGTGKGYPNFADKSSTASKAIAWAIIEQMRCKPSRDPVKGQTTGGLFEEITKSFIEEAFSLLNHIRPGKWGYSTTLSISEFDQYKHLKELDQLTEQYSELASILGQDYIIRPDIVVGRYPLDDDEINSQGEILSTDSDLVVHTPLRSMNIGNRGMLLHASISCKWTIRSDRTQNTRTEALNLIRNRKGNLPHVVAVTGEPLPTRIAALALGTGDLDCVYHFALNELTVAVRKTKNEDQLDMLMTLIGGRRLRDISDLPFDLAV